VQALIAARLDTLSGDRKSLLQDAAVIGKVFWGGALAAMGERDPREVELALHELARKELVRPARVSSMQGEQEFGFWHLLIRDVCYAQIPRSSRAARHRAAAAWVESHAGERVDDLSDVLAYHYVQALELARAIGQEQDIPQLEAAARRYLALAGERALPIDVASAEASFARALELTPAGRPERAGLLEHWAQAARQQGRLPEARAALEEALALHTDQRVAVAAGRTLTTLSNVLRTTGDPRHRDLIAEALRLLEAEAPGPELVTAYAELAGNRAVDSDYSEAIAAAERSLQLAADLGLPESARALGYRGIARASLGDAQGLSDMRRAIGLAVEQGLGRDAAVLYNNLALATWQHEGPAAALERCGEGIDFCERRGIAEFALGIGAMSLTFSAACGLSERALAGVDSAAAAQAEAAGDVVLIEARSVQLSLLAKRGEGAQAAAAEQLGTTAREAGEPQMMAMAFAATAQLMLAEGHNERAEALLEELERTGGTRDDPYYAALLPELVRCTLTLGDSGLASRLTAGVEPRTPMQQHALGACRAALAEAAGDHVTAAAGYAEMATRWRQFGNVPELAYALLGQGRCLVALGTPGADGPVREARELFTAMGYLPAASETDALLQRVNLIR
jgi:tetratricopeptide (TPR) repeat protein